MIPFFLIGRLQGNDAFIDKQQNAQTDVAVTYDVSPGRFGDQMLCYLHAKWISYRYGFPLLYKPFLHSDAFALHEKEELWTQEKESNFQNENYSSPHMLWPLRFPPNSYYIECLHKLCLLFPGQSIYAYVFTNDPDPEQIVGELQRNLSHLPIVFSCRQQNNLSHTAVIEDFFSMMQFDCLIRSASNYSLIPAIISDYKVVMTPKHHIWLIDGFSVENYIDQIETIFKR